MKAVIVDIKGKYAAALAEDGEILKVRNEGYSLGDGIETATVRTFKASGRRRLAKRYVSAIAAVLIAAVSFTGAAYALPYGTVSVEGDTAIEYTINRFDMVLDVKGLNEKGEAFAQALDKKEIKYKKVDDVLIKTMEQIHGEGAPGEEEMAEPVIRTETKDQKHSEKLQQNIEEKIREKLPAEGGPMREEINRPFEEGMPPIPEAEPRS